MPFSDSSIDAQFYADTTVEAATFLFPGRYYTQIWLGLQYFIDPAGDTVSSNIRCSFSVQALVNKWFFLIYSTFLGDPVVSHSLLVAWRHTIVFFFHLILSLECIFLYPCFFSDFRQFFDLPGLFLSFLYCIRYC